MSSPFLKGKIRALVLLHASLVENKSKFPNSSGYEYLTVQMYNVFLSLSHHILQISESISEMGSVSWQIVLCLVLAWIIVYLCLIKGVASSGKVSRKQRAEICLSVMHTFH